MDIQARSGVVACMQAAVLAEGTNSGTIKSTVACKYAIDSYHYSKAITDNIAMTAAAAQADLTTCLYLVQIDAAGNVSTVKGDEEPNASAGQVSRGVQFPAPGQGKCPIGAFKVVTSGATFTAGTTDLSASGVTATFYDFVGGVPSRPLLS